MREIKKHMMEGTPQWKKYMKKHHPERLGQYQMRQRILKNSQEARLNLPPVVLDMMISDNKRTKDLPQKVVGVSLAVGYVEKDGKRHEIAENYWREEDNWSGKFETLEELMARPPLSRASRREINRDFVRNGWSKFRRYKSAQMLGKILAKKPRPSVGGFLNVVPEQEAVQEYYFGRVIKPEKRRAPKKYRRKLVGFYLDQGLRFNVLEGQEYLTPKGKFICYDMSEEKGGTNG